ncbi:hypothetical protein PVAND_013652 [Polypedilum vanderplanki]|uniref:Survivin-related apoptosis inhibitor n=1 Tax=Polypedilum vanderplanki TaxID=319348 RepID=E0YL20_POLVA|nr:survivin-related apoptosis inhibitor [Polypedilum vanderplanki]KAG5684418.1 hypothetical protein PVAND_013652 [Polypedilum vanderplanki]
MPSLDKTNSSNISTGLEKLETLLKTLKLFEEDRVKTFEDWSFSEDEKCSISEMAKAGFCFTGDMSKDDDSATCFVCGKVLDGWENTDDPWIEHQKHSANCQFVKMRRSEDELTVEEFLDLFKHISRQYLTNQYKKKEAVFIEVVQNIREIIKNQQF